MLSINCLAATGSNYQKHHHLQNQSCFYPYGASLNKNNQEVVAHISGGVGTRTQILESLPIFVQTLPRLLLDSRNLLYYGCGPGCREKFGQEQSLQVIRARDGLGCKVVQPIFCIVVLVVWPV